MSHAFIYGLKPVALCDVRRCSMCDAVVISSPDSGALINGVLKTNNLKPKTIPSEIPVEEVCRILKTKKGLQTELVVLDYESIRQDYCDSEIAKILEQVQEIMDDSSIIVISDHYVIPPELLTYNDANVTVIQREELADTIQELEELSF
jgi:hypothetical protein